MLTSNDGNNYGGRSPIQSTEATSAASVPIAIDVGNRDGLLAENTALHDVLNRFAIPHLFEVYEGDHGSGVSSRFEQKVLPYFSKNLKF